MALLILIKSITAVYDSPNVAYYCGNTYPWYYSSIDSGSGVPLTCLTKPPSCSEDHYYLKGATFTLQNETFTGYSQYGYIQSAASSYMATSPFYAYTIGDTNPLPAPSYVQNKHYDDDDYGEGEDFRGEGWEGTGGESKVGGSGGKGGTGEDGGKNRGKGKGVEGKGTGGTGGKVAFGLVLNSVDRAGVQWDYAIRGNYTSPFDTSQATVACLYSDCSYTFGLPSTKYYTDDLLKPASAEYLYGYTYSGFATLQQAVDQYIFQQYSSSSSTHTHTSTTSDTPTSGSIPSASTSADTDAHMGSPLSFPSVTTPSANTVDTVSIMASVGLLPTQAYKSDEFQFVISSTLGIFYMMAFLYPVSRMIRALVLDKETRIREAMMMMGLSDAVYNLSWLITLSTQMTLVALLITLVTSTSVFEYSDKFYVFLYFQAFGLAVINMCFLLSTLFSRSKAASLLGPLIFFGSFFPYYAVSDPQFDAGTKTATCILAPACFALGAEVFAAYEGGQVGIQTSNTFIQTSNFSYALCVGMLLFDAVLYGVLAWYLDKVLPSEWGTALPYWFPLAPSYWLGPDAENCTIKAALYCTSGGVLGTVARVCGYRGGGRYASVASEEEEQEDLHADLLPHREEEESDRGGMGGVGGGGLGTYLEPISEDLRRQELSQTCLQITNLRKVYPSAVGAPRVAVAGLDMTLYRDQVTVLLGHNGAGKTTTLNMLVGLTPPSSGDAIFPGGLRVSTDMQRIRNSLGVCPQHDVLFPELTPLQHLEIFAAFKGVKGGTEVAYAMLQEVGLSEKAHCVAATLSGGQRRKLSLGIALIGDSKVVILDEPTSGMDPYSRRSTWSIINRNKKGRVILLTTHFLDEADLLGDRVAIMANGGLRCMGSPLYLKNKFGVGYTLTIVKTIVKTVKSLPKDTQGQGGQGQGMGMGQGQGQVQGQTQTQTQESSQGEDTSGSTSRRLQAVVTQYVPLAEPLSDVGAEQSFRLPFAASPSFVSLFAALEAEVGVLEFGISVTTLEEVFMKVGEMEEKERG
ncbi:hypothetical protein B484DRAFT_417255, partial [Ochromonadaceae sp. CCMP2298]